MDRRGIAALVVLVSLMTVSFVGAIWASGRDGRQNTIFVLCVVGIGALLAYAAGVFVWAARRDRRGR